MVVMFAYYEHYWNDERNAEWNALTINDKRKRNANGTETKSRTKRLKRLMVNGNETQT